MFQSEDHSALNAALDRYPVPMFAAERHARHQPFHLICVNAAHSRATGLKTERIAGMRPLDVLHGDEGRAVERNYETCVNTGEVINYQEELHLKGQLTKWETTLLPVISDGGAQRIIGTALTLGLPAPGTAISDAEYYAAQAQMRLGQIGRFLGMIQDHPDTPEDLRTGAMMVDGLNRSLDHLIRDLRLAVRSKPPVRVDTRDHARPRPRVAS